MNELFLGFKKLYNDNSGPIFFCSLNISKICRVNSFLRLSNYFFYTYLELDMVVLLLLEDISLAMVDLGGGTISA